MRAYRYPHQTNRINRVSVMRAEILHNNFFLEVVGATPNINVTSFTKNKISGQNGVDLCSVIFHSDISLDAWEARATSDAQTPAVGVGYMVGSGGYINANTDVNFDVEDQELNQGDGVYLITIYGQAGGVWYG